VAYASRSLRPPEKNYSATEREALALVWATKVFRPYLYGRKFELITDHCPLTWLRTIKDPRGRIARWIMTLEEHDWTISHKPGKDHTNADALLRRPHAQDRAEPLEDELIQEKLCNAIGFSAEPDWSREQLKESQMRDPLLSQVLEVIGGARPLSEESGEKTPNYDKFRGCGTNWQ
jgi:hypothetical protein